MGRAVPASSYEAWYESNRAGCERADAATRAETQAFLKRWRERGGFAGALRRAAAETHPSATAGHMPFPNHRHMGEIG